MVPYNCFGNYEHYLKFSFTCGENCYENEITWDKKKIGMPIKLHEMDYGKALDIFVNRERINSQIFIEIKTSSENKNIAAMKESELLEYYNILIYVYNVCVFK